MEELFFIGMPIQKETRSILDKFTKQVCTGMTDSEKQAYEMGVENTLSAMTAVLEADGEPMLYMPNFKVATEMTLDEVKEYFCK